MYTKDSLASWYKVASTLASKVVVLVVGGGGVEGLGEVPLLQPWISGRG